MLGALQSCGNPNLLPDSSTDVGAVARPRVRFATVSLQMRGTGCSGGAFDLFGYPSDYDAYDAIEILAHQSWVANGKVGMVGISFSGLSKFPAAGTDPPGLAAIAPMSPTDDLFSTGYPGGIYNNGFAAEWINSGSTTPRRPPSTATAPPARSTTPVSSVGQPWTYYEIDGELASSRGVLDLPVQSGVARAIRDSGRPGGPQQVAPGEGLGRSPALFDRRSMLDWASHVRVPVFFSEALQDEQTGPQWPALIDAIPKTTPVFANMVNGGHIDSADPQTISRWLEFLDIYVADKIPAQPTALDALVLDEFAATAASVSAQAPLAASSIHQRRTSPRSHAEFAAQTPRLEALFDSGAGAAGPGNTDSTYSADFSSWPPAGNVTTLSFGAGGSLRPRSIRPTRERHVHPGPRSPTTDEPPAGANAWAADPDWDWLPVPAGDGIAFQTPPFTSPTTIVGPATIDLWVKASGPWRTSRPPLRKCVPRPARRSTSPRDSCAARTRSTPRTRPLFSPTRPTWRARPVTCRQTTTRLSRSPSIRSRTRSAPEPNCGSSSPRPEEIGPSGPSTRWTTASGPRSALAA